jgi:hypothetical protein
MLDRQYPDCVTGGLTGESLDNPTIGGTLYGSGSTSIISVEGFLPGSLHRCTPRQQACLHSILPIHCLLHGFQDLLDVPPNFLVPQVSSKLGSPGQPQELRLGLAPLLICPELVPKLHHGVVIPLVLEHIKLSLGASEPTNQPTAASFWAPLAI